MGNKSEVEAENEEGKIMEFKEQYNEIYVQKGLAISRLDWMK